MAIQYDQGAPRAIREAAEWAAWKVLGYVRVDDAETACAYQVREWFQDHRGGRFTNEDLAEASRIALSEFRRLGTAKLRNEVRSLEASLKLLKGAEFWGLVHGTAVDLLEDRRRELAAELQARENESAR